MVKRDGLLNKLIVTADGSGQVGHAGSALLVGAADRLGLTRALSEAMASTRQRVLAHDLGVVLRDLVVMLADGGDCLADLGALRDQEDLFGGVASDSTAFWVIDSIDAACLKRLRGAVAVARARAWTLGARAQLTVLDVDATLTSCSSQKEQAAGNFKGGYGHHPLLCYLDATGEAPAGILRPGNAGSNSAADHIAVLDLALEQLDTVALEGDILVRADGAGATHALTVYCREAGLRFSFGFDLDQRVRDAITGLPETAWPTGDRRRRHHARALPGRRDHRPRRPHGIAARAASDRAVFRRPRRLPPGGLSHRPARRRRRATGSDRSRPRARRGPDPPSQGLRALEPPLQKLRAQPGVAVVGAHSPRPRRLDQDAAAGRPGQDVKAQAAALPAAAPGRPDRPPRARRRCASPATGPGLANSPPPSRACRRCQRRPPSDRAPATPPRPAPPEASASACPPTTLRRTFHHTSPQSAATRT
ncbi:MAG: transposase [Actinobacteria bacterium]|nr:transposase [Actinomycetota bacterium]